MATLAFVFSLSLIALASLLGLLFTGVSLYLVYVHWKYNHRPGPKRDSFFTGNVPLICRGREQGKIFPEVVAELHGIYGPVVLIWVYHYPYPFVSDPELVRKCLITLNLPKNPYIYANVDPFGQRLARRGLVTEVDHGVWQKHRVLLNPAFHGRNLRLYLGVRTSETHG